MVTLNRELSQLSLGTGQGALSAKLMLPALLPFLNILRVVLRSDGIVPNKTRMAGTSV